MFRILEGCYIRRLSDWKFRNEKTPFRRLPYQKIIRSEGYQIRRLSDQISLEAYQIRSSEDYQIRRIEVYQIRSSEVYQIRKLLDHKISRSED